jgi:putative intracellular protease/amidase
MVLTGSNVWTMKDGTPHPTGLWAEEFTRPHKTFSDAGLKVSIATPQGRTPVVDPLSLALPFNGNDAAAVQSHKTYIASMKSKLESSSALGSIDPADFDVVFIVGGHGPMQDLAVDPDIGGLIAAVLRDENKILASICHGQASFLSAHDGMVNGSLGAAPLPPSAIRRKPWPPSPEMPRGCWKIVSASPERTTWRSRRGRRTSSPMGTWLPDSKVRPPRSRPMRS